LNFTTIASPHIFVYLPPLRLPPFITPSTTLTPLNHHPSGAHLLSRFAGLQRARGLRPDGGLCDRNLQRLDRLQCGPRGAAGAWGGGEWDGIHGWVGGWVEVGWGGVEVGHTTFLTINHTIFGYILNHPTSLSSLSLPLPCSHEDAPGGRFGNGLPAH
jgi:hypothetical protein